MADPTITVAYAALADTVSGLALVEPSAEVEVLVVVQGGDPGPLPAGVRVERSTATGAAASRNVALDVARGRFLVFADDDSAVVMDGVRQVVDHFERHVDLAVVQGRSVDPGGTPRKRFPTRRRSLSRWNAAKIGTIELVVRCDAVRGAGVRFDERFGAGAEHPLGDEYVFVADALEAGLRSEFLPITVAAHPADSSGMRYGSVADARARAAVFDRVFGRLAVLARAAFAARRPRRFGSLGLTLRFVFGRFPS